MLKKCVITGTMQLEKKWYATRKTTGMQLEYKWCVTRK